MNIKKFLSLKIIIPVFVLLFVYFALFTFAQNDNKHSLCVNAEEITTEFVLDENLKAYFVELNGGKELERTSFSDLTKLTFDVQNQNVQKIVRIDGLEQFDWSNLQSIEIVGLSSLQSINLAQENDNCFPLLKNVDVEDNVLLEELYLSGNNQIVELTIMDNYLLNEIVFPSLNECCKLFLKDINVDKQIEIQDLSEKIQSISISDSSGISQISVADASSLVSLTIDNLQNLIIFNLENNIHLQSIKVCNVPALQSFVMSNCKSATKISFDDGTDLKKSTNLKTFILTDNSCVNNFDFSFTDKLEILSLSGCNQVQSLSFGRIDNLITLNLSNLVNLIATIDFSSATKLQEVNLKDCRMLSDATFDSIENLSNLVRLDVGGCSVTKFDFEAQNKLTIMLIDHCEYLTSISVVNAPNLVNLNLSECQKLSSIYLRGTPNLEEFRMENSKSLTDLELDCGKLEIFEVVNLNCLTSIEINQALSLKTLYVENCAVLEKLSFESISNLQKLVVIDCPYVEDSFATNLSKCEKLTEIRIGNCDSFYSFEFSNSNCIKSLDISSLNNLSSLIVKDIQCEFGFLLPNKCTNLKTLVLKNLPYAQLASKNLSFNNANLTKVQFENLKIDTLDLSGNYIINAEFKNLPSLQSLNLASNNLSDFDTIMSDFENLQNLALINLNENRFDMTIQRNKTVYEISNKHDCILLGLQNVINKNTYSYIPKIFIGNFDLNIKLKIYHSNKIIDSPLLYESDSRFGEVSYPLNSEYSLERGTYIFKFFKIVDGNEVEILPGDNLYSSYKILYNTITKQVPWIRTVWIVFFIIAGITAIFVIVSYIVDRRKNIKNAVLSKDYDNEQVEENLSYKEARKLFRENKAKIKEQMHQQKILNKEQKQAEREKKIQEKQKKKEQQLAKQTEKKQAQEKKKEEKRLQKEKIANEKLLKLQQKEQERKLLLAQKEQEKREKIKQLEQKRQEEVALKKEKIQKQNQERLNKQNIKKEKEDAKRSKKIEKKSTKIC